MKRHVFAAAFGALMVILPLRQALRADAALYTVEDLGLIGGVAPTVTAMNANGQLTGHVPGGQFGLPQAVMFRDGSWQLIQGTGTFYSLATGINEAGDVVGYAHTGAAGFRAFRYTAGPGISFIDPLPGDSMSFGHAIDAAGNVFGQSASDVGGSAFRAAPGLPALALSVTGFTVTRACGINEAGQIAGYGANASGYQQAFRVEADGSVTDILSFDGATGSSEGCAIDAVGRVGGHATSDGVLRAFTFASGSPVNADTFASTQSKMEAVSAGVAVGWFLAADGTFHAIVNAAGASFDLNDLVTPGTGWQLDQAFAVNTNGSIAGIGRLNGEPRAFRLTRVEAGDTAAPVIAAVTASPATISLPDNAMVTVTVSVIATDDSGESPACSVTGIDGHGAPATDFLVTGGLTGWVRARGGATYSFAVSCADAAGNAASGSVDVVVPPDTTAPVISSVSANPSSIWPPNGSLVPVAVAVSATDNSGAAPSCELSSVNVVPTSGADDYATTGPLSAKVRAVGGRTYTLVVTCGDTAGNRSSAGVAIVVPPDTKAPVIESVTASPGAIWPPNGKMVHVNVAVSATDDVDALSQCSLKSVVVAGGDAGDAVVTGNFTADLRAEKNGDGSTRTYKLKVACRDAAGNTSWGSTTVVVSKDATSAKNAAARKLGLARTVVKAMLGKAAAKHAAQKGPNYFSRGSSR